MMTYEEAIGYIHSISWRGSRPGLSRITELTEMIGNPQDSLSFVHIAGTNGKGSLSCMLESILRAAGYKTGLFTSPFVKDFTERMRVSGRDIGKEQLAECTEYVKSFADKMADPPTEFELITAIAFEYFKREACDIVVCEVGMGGRLDSTNVIKAPALAVITEIALDHTAYLGSTVEAIAGEKAGIIKKGSRVLFTGTDGDARRVVLDAAKRAGAPFATPDYGALRVTSSSVDGSDFCYRGAEYHVPLAGLYQPRNAAAAIEAAAQLRLCGYDIPDSAVKNGIASAVWHARFELLSRDPVIIYDGGHNPQGVGAAFESIKAYFPNKRVVAVSGVMADKDYDVSIGIASPYISRVYTVRPDNPRALSAVDYADAFRRHGTDAVPCGTVIEAVKKAVADAKAYGAPMLVFGSLYLYAEAAEAIREALR